MKTTLLKWSFDQVLYTHFLFLYKFIFSGGPNAVPLLFFVSILALSGCNPAFYAPGPQTPPAFVRKGESKLTAAFTHTRGASGYEACFAHTPYLHLSILGNHLTYSGGFKANEVTYFGHGYFNELGLGYYTGSDKPKQFIFDVCFYHGYGNMAFRSSGTLTAHQNYYVESKFQKSSVLTGFTYLSRYLETAFSLKCSLLAYEDTRFSHFSPGDKTIALMDNQNKYLIEPALVVRAGTAALKGFVGLEMAHKIKATPLSVASQRVSMGVIVKF